jgi:hypothetical protein
MLFRTIRISERLCRLSRSLVLLAALFLACGEQPKLLNEIPRVSDTDSTRMTVEELPPMPPYPRARGGRLVTVSAGDYDIHGSWETTAGLCGDLGVLEMYAGPSGLGTALILQMPEDDVLGEYPVVAATAVFPSAPAALLAVQVFDEPEAFGFQAYDGQLELTEMGEVVSGRFAMTLREINMDVLTHYVGVFENIPIEPLTDEYCAMLRDSTVVPISSQARDPPPPGT